ncbi:MAG: methyltransferase [Candidatus Manganitrophus sp.]|nr:methyltransferase [Candidatus Manganitrophus sp.]MDC4225715.1 methyltransferase [Candidatus Manganitrophus sp.]WDT72958.1 MAG: methyltransferase [Candidatus Manganitrophus sp.]
MIRTYEELLRTADAFTDSRTLIAGVELDLFTHIGKKPATAKEIARRADASPEGVEFLLNALTGMGLLAKSGERYRNTPLSRTYLDTASIQSITNFIWLAGQHWDDWIGLADAVRKGRRPKKRPPPDNPAFRKHFSKALHERSFYLAPKILRPIDLRGARTLLDLGGGAGSYAFALLVKYPELHATIFDRPAAVKVALAEAKRADLSEQVDVIGGDLFTDDYGGPYDVIFYSNVVHIYSPEENRRVLKKIKKALKPGGRLIIVEYFLDKDQAHPPDVSSFNLMMLLFTERGRCYTWQEATAWLKRAGFSRFRQTRVDGKIGILEATLGSTGRRKPASRPR